MLSDEMFDKASKAQSNFLDCSVPSQSKGDTVKVLYKDQNGTNRQ